MTRCAVAPLAAARCPNRSPRCSRRARPLGRVAAVGGCSSVVCSVMLYHVHAARVVDRAAARLQVLRHRARCSARRPRSRSRRSSALSRARPQAIGRLFAHACVALPLLAGVKLVGELSVLCHLRDRQHGDAQALGAAAARRSRRRRCALRLACRGARRRASRRSRAAAALDAGIEALGARAGARGLSLLSSPVSCSSASLFFAALSAPRMPGGCPLMSHAPRRRCAKRASIYYAPATARSRASSCARRGGFGLGQVPTRLQARRDHDR